ncbi:MAG: T9SS type A sorting domain-containing protein [Bacteroidetes bacterium]|nr:T9SS type A sorting domain-containing protein [Bacteroidota bacterium]
MKKYLILTIIAFLLIQTQVICQISLINTYNEAVYVTNIEDVGYKYFGVDFEASQCLIYNLDHSLWKSINIDVAANNYIDDVAYVSSKLFNNDNNIELLVVFYEYIITSDTSGYYYYTTKVINENGVTFLDVPGGGYSSIYKVDDAEANLLVYVYDFSIVPFTSATNVYSIPGVPYSVNEIEGGIKLKNAFPNPAVSFITIPYEVNQSSGDASILIYNELGVEVYRKKINPDANNYRLNTMLFSKGVYFYNIKTAGYKSPSRKIIIQ